MLCLLGPPEVTRAGELEPLPLRPKALALLAYLALANRGVARRKLASLLFPDSEDPLGALRWHLSYLRSSTPPEVSERIDATRDSIELPVLTDVDLFRQGCARLQEVPDALDATQVLGLYRDDLLTGLSVSADVDFDTWLYVEQEGLRRLFRRATAAFARHVQGSERVAEAIGPLSRLVSVDPYFEDAHVLLVEAYAALGEPDRAAATYDRYQRIVRQELHAEPRPSMVARHEGRSPAGRCLPLEELVTLREMTMHILDWSGGEPAILALHGSTSSGQVMAMLAEDLTPAFRLVAPDLRGHGFSDKPPSGYCVEDHVQDIRQLIEALGLRRPVLLGHSAGGAIATFVATHVDVSGLVLLEGMVGDRAFQENAAARVAPSLHSLGMRVGGFDTYVEQWRADGSPWRSQAERMLDRWVRYELAPMPDGTYRRRALPSAVEAEWRSIIDADTLGALARVRCPILIVQALQPWVGGRPYFTDAIIDAQLRAAPGAELFTAGLSHHTALVRNPEPEMVQAIAHFIEAATRQVA